MSVLWTGNCHDNCNGRLGICEIKHNQIITHNPFSLHKMGINSPKYLFADWTGFLLSQHRETIRERTHLVNSFHILATLRPARDHRQSFMFIRTFPLPNIDNTNNVLTHGEHLMGKDSKG
jgi:hypothetical protein